MLDSKHAFPLSYFFKTNNQNLVILTHVVCFIYLFPGLNLMFRLMDRVPDGINPMLHDLEQHIMQAGLADMFASAEVITTVSRF